MERNSDGSEALRGKIVMIVANEFEDIELLYPLLRLSEEGDGAYLGGQKYLMRNVLMQIN
jgi:hypothetical protein